MSNRYPAPLSILLALLLIARFGSAQAYLQPGYIVSLAGDTTRGLVASLNGQNSAQGCHFRPNKSADEVIYKPTQLRAYGRGEQQFETYPVATGEQKVESRFLAVVERGLVNLYFLVDINSQERYFINGAPGFIVELRRVVRPRPDKGSSLFEIDNFYQDELAQAFQNCPSVLRQVRQVSFNLSSLQQAVQRYNRCQSPAAATTGSNRRMQLRLSAVLGLPTYHTLRLGEGHGRVASDDRLKGDLYPTVGLLVSTGSTLHNPHVSFVTGVLFEIDRAYSAQRRYPNLSYSIFYQNSQIVASFNYVKVPLLVRYRWSGAMVRPYLEAGLAVRRLLALRRNFVADHYEAAAPFPVVTRPLLNPRYGLTPAPVVGGGVQLGHAEGRWFSLGGQIEFSRGPELLSAPQNYSRASRLLSANVLLAYDLLK